jgi:hypothetical protein
MHHERAPRLLLSLASPFLAEIPIIQLAPQEYYYMANPSPFRLLSLDTWAVLLAFAAALLVRFGVVKSIPW